MKISGTTVALVAALAMVATLVIPPAGAVWLNERRVAATTAALVQIADSLRQLGPAGVDRPGQVQRGPGRWPDLNAATARARGLDWDVSHHADWLAHAQPVLPSVGGAWPPDAWGNCVFVRSLGDGYLIVSAGSNGLIDTPLTAGSAVGDDVGVRVKWP